MTANGQDKLVHPEPSSPLADDELLKEARQLGTEILALVNAHFSSRTMARAFVDEMSHTIASGLVIRTDTSSVPRATAHAVSSGAQQARSTLLTDAQRSELYGPSNPRTVRVEAIHKYDPPTGGCEITFANDGGGLTGRTGDLIAMCPRNEPDDVRQLLRAFGMRGIETVTMGRKSGPIWRVLLEDVEITRISNAFREALRDRNSYGHKGLLIDEYIRTANPSLLALLRRFPTLGKCFEEFVNCAYPLVPQKGSMAGAVGDRETQLNVLLSDQAYESVKSAGIAFKVGGWVPVFVEQRVETHLNDNGELPLVIISDAFGAHLALSYAAERQRLGHRGRTWIIAFGAGISQTLRFDLEQWQQRETLGRFDWCPDCVAEREATMLWRWFVDRSTFCIIGIDPSSTRTLEEKVLATLIGGSGKAADWLVRQLAERRDSALYRTVTMV